MDKIMGALLEVLKTDRAKELFLSKGGWEGWLQCELWSKLNMDFCISTQREIKYDLLNYFCDLVVDDLWWVEIKAFGLFRGNDVNNFVGGVIRDVDKINHRPIGTYGVVFCIVAAASNEIFKDSLGDRWPGHVVKYCGETVIYMEEFDIKKI